MINLFAVAQNDASIYYLSKIFGNVGGVLGQGGSITLLSTMFKTFNSVILTVAVLLLIYITIIGVIGTAHEGEFMGKKMNNIWIPIRAVLGIALLVPTGAGYCGIQIVMMWVIVQGIGAADVLWNTALNYITIVGTPYAQVGVSEKPGDPNKPNGYSVPTTNGQQVFSGLFQGLVCDISLRHSDPKNLGGYCNNSPGGCGTTPPPFDPKDSMYKLGPNGECGVLTYCNQGTGTNGTCKNSNSLECYACKAQGVALTNIVATFTGIAQQLVDADYSYRDFSANSWDQSKTNNSSWQWIYSYCTSSSPNPDGSEKKVIQKTSCCVGGATDTTGTCSKSMPNVDGDTNTSSASSNAVQNLYWPYWPGLEPSLGNGENFIKIATDHYTDLANGAVTNYIQSQGQGPNNELNTVIGNSQANGWIYAGAFYQQLASLQSKKLQESVTTLKWEPAKFGLSSLTNARNNIDAANYLAQIAAGKVATGTNSNTSQASDFASGAMGQVTAAFETNVSNESATNPLLMLQIFGSIMLVIAQAIFAIIIALVLIFGFTSDINAWGLGTGLYNPESNWAIMMTIFVVPFVYMIMGVLVSVGGLMAIYLPMLPYIYFTFGAIAWIFSTVEAMVAGPLIALAIISPSGQHEIMGKAEPALMLLFNIFLRPSLMIFGLMAAMLLASVVCMMINATFAILFTQTGLGHDILSLILVLVAYVSLIIAALNKCFSVINLIPQKVTSWIGGQGEAVEAPTEQIKGAVEAGGGKSTEQMRSSGERGEKQASRKAKTEAAKAEKEKKGEGDGGIS